MKLTFIFGDEEKSLFFDSPVLLLQAAEKACFYIARSCSGAGKCGKCALKAQGLLSAVLPAEINALGEKALRSGFRLACQCKAMGDALITLEKSPPESEAENKFYEDESTGLGGPFAAAYDIGTTTLSAGLYSLSRASLVSSVSELNEQRRFGEDVISRINHANSGGAALEREAIRRQLERIEASFPEKPLFSVITGNTAMLHLYTGESVKELAAAPFKPATLFGECRQGAYFPPCIGAFVGADISCAVLYSGMADKKRSAFLIDIGTNGEMVYYRDGEFLCCSTAAGPAFEGAGISSGMTASPGAVDRVFLQDGEIRYTVIGGIKAKGLAGSGLIDAVACMLELRVLDESGFLEKEFFIGDSGVCISPADIRAVQLAKAAIRAGIETLCGDIGSVDDFYIAGSFGSHLNLGSCVKIGLIPPRFAENCRILGNGALGGAAQLLLDKSAMRKISFISEHARDINLGGMPEFSEKYIECMYF